MSEDRTAKVSTLWERGFGVGMPPDADCQQCAHNWGAHLLHMEFGEDDIAHSAGRVSCPAEGCTCTATWSPNWPGRNGEPCAWGRTLLRSDIEAACTETATTILRVPEIGKEFELCRVHFDLIECEMNKVVSQRLDQELNEILPPPTDLGLESGDTDLIVLHNGATLRTHGPSQCAGPNCCIHNPSDHPLKDAPLNWRDDRGMMERLCPHGIGHPDPDDQAYKRLLDEQRPRPDEYGPRADDVHGCDGCCASTNLSA